MYCHVRCKHDTAKEWKFHHFAPDVFLFLAYGRTERGPWLYSLSRVTSSLSPLSPTPILFSLTGPLYPLPSCPSKIKLRPTVLANPRAKYCPYRAPQLKDPVPSTIASGVVCRERTDSGSAGRRVHMPLSSLPVSLRLTSGANICAITLLTFPGAGLNVLVIFIPLAWVSHFHEWTHGLTFARMS